MIERNDKRLFDEGWELCERLCDHHSQFRVLDVVRLTRYQITEVIHWGRITVSRCCRRILGWLGWACVLTHPVFFIFWYVWHSSEKLWPCLPDPGCEASLNLGPWPTHTLCVLTCVSWPIDPFMKGSCLFWESVCLVVLVSLGNEMLSVFIINDKVRGKGNT